jgi:hypothetical protein
MSNTLNDLLLRKKIIQSGSTRSGLTRAQRYSQISRNNFRRLPAAIENAPKPELETTVLLNGQDIQTVGNRSITVVDDNRRINGTTVFDGKATFDNTSVFNGEATFNGDITMGGGILKVNTIEPYNSSESTDISFQGSFNVRNFFRARANAKVDGNFDVGAATTLNTLTVGAATTLDTLTVGAATTLNTLTVENDTNLKNLTINDRYTITSDGTKTKHETAASKGHLFKQQINCGGLNQNSNVDLYVNSSFQIRKKFTDSGYIFNTYNDFGDPYGELLVIGDKDDATGIAFFQHSLTKTTTIESKNGDFSIRVGSVNDSKNGGKDYNTKVYVDNTGKLLVGDGANDISKEAKLVVEDEQYVKAVFKESGGSGGGSAIRVKNESKNYWDMAIGENNKFALNYNNDSFGELFLLDSSGVLEIGDTEGDKFKLTPRNEYIEYSSTNQKHYFNNKMVIGDIGNSDVPSYFEENYALNVEGVINATEIYLDGEALSSRFQANLNGKEGEEAVDLIVQDKLTIDVTDDNNSATLVGRDPKAGENAENKIILYERPTGNMIFESDPSGSILFDTSGVNRMEITNNGRINIKNSTLLNHSDKRIKDNIQPINSLNSLESIRKIEPKTYNYTTHDTGTKYGFIAQEIRKIIPEAVNIHDEVIALPKKKIQYTYTIIEDSIHLSIDDVIEIQEDDMLTIQVERMREQILHYKPSVSPTYPYIWLNSKHIDISDYPILHLKARIIPDFHSLDYQPLWTVLTSAVQELDKQNTTAREEINELKKENKTLRTELEELKKYVYSL